MCSKNVKNICISTQNCSYTEISCDGRKMTFHLNIMRFVCTINLFDNYWDICIMTHFQKITAYSYKKVR